MQQSKTTPQLHFSLGEELPLQPLDRERIIALLAALLLDVAENEASDDGR